MQCSWVKRLFKDDFHDWKEIALLLIGKHSGKNSKFHNNIDINNDILSKFPSCHQDILIKLITILQNQLFPSTILREFIWFNSNIN